METVLIPASHYYGDSKETASANDFLVPLNCQRDGDLKPISILVRKVYRDQFIRIRPELLTALDQADDPAKQLSGHQDIYIKQQQGTGQTLRHVFSIDISSALTQHILVDAKQPDFDTYWQSGTDEDTIFLVLEEDAKPPRGLLYFCAEAHHNDAQNNDDRFALVLSVALNHAGLDIIRPPRGLPWLRLHRSNWAKVRRGDRRSGLDKLSMTLGSGASVSAELRKNGKSTGIQRYLVEIRVDPKGSLPWPDPDTDPHLALTSFGGLKRKNLERAYLYSN
jgi:hypothetical protein